MKKVLIASLLSSLFAAPAFAAAPGPYVALDAQDWSTSNNAPLGNAGLGLRIGGGYRFTENWGVEANYAQSGSSSSVFGVSDKMSAFQVAATGTYPINQMFDLYAKLGMSANKVSLSGATWKAGVSDSKTSLLYGVGGQYNINNNWGVRVEWAHLGDAMSNSLGVPNISNSTLSVGGVYTF